MLQRGVEGDAAGEERLELLGTGRAGESRLALITPRSIRSASDCSIVCMPRLVPVWITE